MEVYNIWSKPYTFFRGQRSLTFILGFSHVLFPCTWICEIQFNINCDLILLLIGRMKFCLCKFTYMVIRDNNGFVGAHTQIFHCNLSHIFIDARDLFSKTKLTVKCLERMSSM